MKNLWMIARREMVVRGKSKAYLTGLGISALLMVVLAILPGLLGGDESYQVGVVGTDSEVLAKQLPAAGETSGLTIEVTEFDNEDAARTALTDDDFDLAIIDDSTMLSDGDPNAELSATVNAVHQSVVSQQQLTEAGFDVNEVNEALTVAPLEEKPLNGDDASARQGIAYVLVIALFMMVMMPTMYVATGVVEEKSSRIVEILLASVKSWQLLAGKVVGLGVLGFVNLAVPLLAGYAVGSATGAVDQLPPGLSGTILSALVWWVLGFGFFAAMAGGLASLVSRQEDMNSAIGPLTMLMVGCYLVASIYVWQPTSTVSRVLSFVPPVSMWMMPVRDAAGDAPLWQQVLSGGLLALAVAGMFWMGATIYRRSVMRTGSKVKLTEVLRRSHAN